MRPQLGARTSRISHRIDTGLSWGVFGAPLRALFAPIPHHAGATRPPEPELAPFQLQRHGADLLLTRIDAGLALSCLDAAQRRGSRGSIVGMVEGGRTPHPVIALEGGERAVVKEYLRGGAIRHLNRARYFFGHRALAELIATERARNAGVRAPAVLLAAERRLGVGYTARLGTRWIAHGRHGEAWLRGASLESRNWVLVEAGRQIALMHDAGIAHPDLNLRNLLIVGSPDTAEPLVYLLDFDRARLYPAAVPATRRARDLERLGRSARKLELALEFDDGWRALRAGYGAAWPLARPSII